MRNPYWSYQVIKCSKLFKEINRFSCTIDQWLSVKPKTPTRRDYRRDYNIVKRGTAVGVKANIEHGLIVGKLKRRWDWWLGVQMIKRKCTV